LVKPLPPVILGIPTKSSALVKDILLVALGLNVCALTPGAIFIISLGSEYKSLKYLEEDFSPLPANPIVLSGLRVSISYILPEELFEVATSNPSFSCVLNNIPSSIDLIIFPSY